MVNDKTKRKFERKIKMNPKVYTVTAVDKVYGDYMIGATATKQKAIEIMNHEFKNENVRILKRIIIQEWDGTNVTGRESFTEIKKEIKKI